MTGPSDTEPLPISLVAQHMFCPRRAWLEAAGETTDTYLMAVGIAEHLPTENPTTGRPDRLRIVEVVHPEWGIIGRCDTVESESDGSLTVIAHKATPVRRRPDVTGPMRVQLALQVESLKSMGYRVCGQEVYFTSYRVSVPVRLAEADISEKAVLQRLPGAAFIEAS
jgi:CRISPR-associated protein Cas1